MKTISELQWVGIDVSQASLDIALRPAGSTWQVSNTDSGRQELLTQLSELVVVLVVVESTAEGAEGRFYDLCQGAMKRTEEQRARYRERQRQEAIAKARGTAHVGAEFSDKDD